MQDKEVIDKIENLLEEENKLHAKNNLSRIEKGKLDKLKVDIDRYWDLLRQRRALREFGNDPDKAKLRGSDTVENYKQ